MPDPQATATQSPTVIVANSFVARGRVGSRAQAPALERHGYEPWLVPTVLLPHHPGHGAGTRIVPPEDAFCSFCADLAAQDDLNRVGAVLTGYLGARHQVAPLVELIAKVRAANPDVIVICDPVIGDERGLYVDEAIALGILENLVPPADLITPNRHELGWLTGHPVETNMEIIEAIAGVSPESVLVTSAHPMMRGNAANLLAVGPRAWLAEARAIADPPHGPGDLIAALLCANLLSGAQPEQALAHVTAATHEVLAAGGSGARELALVKGQEKLTMPTLPVSLRTLATR